jgi:hypothetical protein
MGRAPRLGFATLALAALAAACGGVASASPTGFPVPDDFPLGSWTVTITAEDLRAAGITDAGLINENAGVFTKTYNADGTWTVAQETDAPIRWPVFSGTYRVTGPNEFEELTRFPEDYAGDVVRFTWTRDGENVRFSVVNSPDPILPILTEAHPWQPA